MPDKYFNLLEELPGHTAGLIRNPKPATRLARFICFFLIIVLISLFIPWTQNIRAYGNLTTFLPQDRPQTVQTIIGGRVEKWFVREGQFVQKGDTIVKLSEVKEKYFDPRLLERLSSQIEAKEGSQDAANQKVAALAKQIQALHQEKKLSLEKAKNKVIQAELKIQSDSAEFKTSQTDLDIAQLQVARADSLFNKGLIALNELERRKLKIQESRAKRVSAENKYASSKNELINYKIELNSLEAEYTTKISKAESELNSAMSYVFETEAEIAKMNNEFSNLSIRSGYYFVLAPQDGYVVQAKISGVGENLKEGEVICSIMPLTNHPAIQLYVKPMDIPLLSKGRKVRLQFDGWPALVFSGWPNYTFGTFGGEVAVIDNIDTKGNYRILVVPDKKDNPWPEQLRVGSGAYGWIMLKEVPIWYELWRQFNGFPPDYIQDDLSKSEVKKSK